MIPQKNILKHNPVCGVYFAKWSMSVYGMELLKVDQRENIFKWK